MRHKIIKLDVVLEIDTCLLSGKPHWRARNSKLLLEAHGQTPEEAAERFKTDMLRGTIKSFDPEVADEVKAQVPELEEEVESEEAEAPEYRTSHTAQTPETDFEKLTKAQLVEIADAAGVHTKGMTKAQLLAVVLPAGPDEEDEYEGEEEFFDE